MSEIGESLLELAQKYSNLVVLGSDCSYECRQFKQYFPDRYFDFGSGLENMISAAVGFVVRGKMPVLLGEGLLMKGFQQLKYDICEPNLNVKIVDFGEISEAMLGELGLARVGDFDQLVEGYGPRLLTVE